MQRSSIALSCVFEAQIPALVPYQRERSIEARFYSRHTVRGLGCTRSGRQRRTHVDPRQPSRGRAWPPGAARPSSELTAEPHGEQSELPHSTSCPRPVMRVFNCFVRTSTLHCADRISKQGDALFFHAARSVLRPHCARASSTVPRAQKETQLEK